MSPKTVVVTGSSRGLGLAMARTFAQRGHRVFLHGRNPERLAATHTELSEHFGERIAGSRAADVREVDEVRNLYAVAASALGSVDVWVNNAGVAVDRVAPALDVDLQSLRRPIEVNLLGSLNCMHVVGERMREAGGGAMYVMEGFGSDGKRTQLGLSAYGASKAGLAYLGRAWRKELAESGVRVGRISPGMVVTDLLLAPYGEGEPPEDVMRVFRLLADRPETVAPFIVSGVEAGKLDIVWLTTAKLLGRLMSAPFRKRDPFKAG